MSAASQKVILSVTWQAYPEHADRVAELLKAMIVHTRQEPGNIQYEVHRSSEIPSKFFLYEVYADEEAVKAHKESKYFKEYVLEGAVPLLEKRERSVYRELEWTYHSLILSVAKAICYSATHSRHIPYFLLSFFFFFNVWIRGTLGRIANNKVLGIQNKKRLICISS